MPGREPSDPHERRADPLPSLVQAISGDAFDATTILIDETIKRIKTDIRHENAVRREHGQELLPEPWCIWGVTPFKADSRMSQSLTRRSFVFLEVRSSQAGCRVEECG